MTEGKQVIRRRTEYLLREAKRRGHVLEGQLIAIADIDGEGARVVEESGAGISCAAEDAGALAEGEPKVVQLVPPESGAADSPGEDPPRPPNGPRPALKRIK